MEAEAQRAGTREEAGVQDPCSTSDIPQVGYFLARSGLLCPPGDSRGYVVNKQVTVLPPGTPDHIVQ